MTEKPAQGKWTLVLEGARKWLPMVLVVSTISGLTWVEKFGEGISSKIQNLSGVTLLSEKLGSVIAQSEQNAALIREVKATGEKNSHDIEGIKDDVAALAVSVERNADAIRSLRQPADIFEISRQSGPVDGYCVEGEPCAVNIRVRRHPDALVCRIVPETLIYYYRNPRNNEVYDTVLLSGSPRDVGTSFINLQFTFSTPSNLIPNAELCVKPSYVGCPGMIPDDPPISPDEECFEVSIMKTAPSLRAGQ